MTVHALGFIHWKTAASKKFIGLICRLPDNSLVFIVCIIFILNLVFDSATEAPLFSAVSKLAKAEAASEGCLLLLAWLGLGLAAKGAAIIRHESQKMATMQSLRKTIKKAGKLRNKPANPSVTAKIIKLNPKTTPKRCARPERMPKLLPVAASIMLLGPGVDVADMANIDTANICSKFMFLFIRN